MTARIFSFPPMVKHKDNPPNRVREQRKARGMTQADLADLLGTKQHTVSRIENGDMAVTVDRYRQIARALKVDIGQLLAPEDNRMGLDDAGLALVHRMAVEPQLAATLTQLHDVVRGYDAGPAQTGMASDATQSEAIAATGATIHRMARTKR